MNFVNQLQSVVKQNQSKREITFGTQLKTVPKVTNNPCYPLGLVTCGIVGHFY